MTGATSYPTEDDLNFTGIDFSTPVSQIGKLETRNPNLAINVFGKQPRDCAQNQRKTQRHSTYKLDAYPARREHALQLCVKRVNALLYGQSRHNESKRFFERCLHGYARKELPERHKPECEGLLKRPIRAVLPKE